MSPLKFSFSLFYIHLECVCCTISYMCACSCMRVHVSAHIFMQKTAADTTHEHMSHTQELKEQDEYISLPHGCVLLLGGSQKVM